jgi:hypothetical protein
MGVVLSGNRDVQRTKKEVNKKRKQDLQHSKGANTAAGVFFFMIVKLHSSKRTLNGLGRIDYLVLRILLG